MSRHATVWMTLAGLCFTIALFAVAQRSAISRSELCASSNRQAQVLIAAMDGNLASLEVRKREGDVSPAAYKFARELLLKNRRLAVSSICRNDGTSEADLTYSK